MAVDDETKRVSALNAGTLVPGKAFMPSEPDGSDLDDANQRGFVLWHYAGISAGAVAAAAAQVRLGYQVSILKEPKLLGSGL